jgi:hypothetical protein
MMINYLPRGIILLYLPFIFARRFKEGIEKRRKLIKGEENEDEKME